MVQQRTGLQLDEVKKLNMWGMNLTDVSVLEKMPNLEIASFSVNQISSLKPFEKCTSLTELFLRRNQISDFNELQHLAHLKNLKTIWLLDNPISSDPQYREKVMQILPDLIKLDEAEITEIEKLSVAAPRPPVRHVPAKSFPDLDPEIIEKPKHVQSDPQPRPRVALLKMPEENRRDDAIVKAILALLPELSDEGFAIIEKEVELRSSRRRA